MPTQTVRTGHLSIVPDASSDRPAHATLRLPGGSLLHVVLHPDGAFEVHARSDGGRCLSFEATADLALGEMTMAEHGRLQRTSMDAAPESEAA